MLLLVLFVSVAGQTPSSGDAEPSLDAGVGVPEPAVPVEHVEDAEDDVDEGAGPGSGQGATEPSATDRPADEPLPVDEPARAAPDTEPPPAPVREGERVAPPRMASPPALRPPELDPVPVAARPADVVRAGVGLQLSLENLPDVGPAAVASAEACAVPSLCVFGGLSGGVGWTTRTVVDQLAPPGEVFARGGGLDGVLAAELGLRWSPVRAGPVAVGGWALVESGGRTFSVIVYEADAVSERFREFSRQLWVGGSVGAHADLDLSDRLFLRLSTPVATAGVAHSFFGRATPATAGSTSVVLPFAGFIARPTLLAMVRF